MNIDKKLLDAMLLELSNFHTVEKAVLFGSRARGDHNERSDYDIAIYGDINARDKSSLHNIFDEKLPTLHKIDLIFYNDTNDKKFKNSIDTEGIIIYGKAR